MHKTKIELLGIKYFLGLGFLNELVNGTGKKLTDFEGMDDALLIPLLMYYSRLYACKRLGVIVDFTQEDIFDYIDENGGVGGQLFADFSQAYIKAMTQDVPVSDKKKVIPTKLK